jgi:hypothetical protein
MASEKILVHLDETTPSASVVSTPTLKLAALPSDVQVYALVIEMVATMAGTGGGNAGSVYPSALATKVTSVEHKSDFLLIHQTGSGIVALHQQQWGKQTLNALASPGAGATVRSYLSVWFFDPRCARPSYGTLPGSFLNNQTINVGLSATQAFGTTTSMSALTLRLFAVTGQSIPGFNPAAQAIRYEDWSGQTAVLNNALYKDIIIYSEAQASLTLADITTVTLLMDGAPVLQNTYAEYSLYLFDEMGVFGGEENNLVEQESDDGFSFFPFYTPPRNYQPAQLKGSMNGGAAQITGNLTSPRYLYHYFTDSEGLQNDAATLGKLQSAAPNHSIGRGKHRTTSGANARQTAMLQKYSPKINT